MEIVTNVDFRNYQYKKKRRTFEREQNYGYGFFKEPLLLFLSKKKARAQDYNPKKAKPPRNSHAITFMEVIRQKAKTF